MMRERNSIGAATPSSRKGSGAPRQISTNRSTRTWDLELPVKQGEIHPKNLTKTLLSVCDPTRAVQLATKGGDID